MSIEQYQTKYETMNLLKCFVDSYVVPEYQREYDWTPENTDQLMRDLISAFYHDSQKPYFMGMVVVYGVSCYIKVVMCMLPFVEF